MENETDNAMQQWQEAPRRDWVRLDGPGCWYQDKDCKMYWREGVQPGFEAWPVGPLSTDPVLAPRRTSSASAAGTGTACAWE